MDDDVIVLDSDEEESKEINQKKVETKSEEKLAIKRPAAIEVSPDETPEKKIRRVQPTKIGEVDVKPVRRVSGASSKECINGESSNLKIGESPSQDPEFNDQAETTRANTSIDSQETEASSISSGKRNEFTEELELLIKACRMAEPSVDMKTIIKKKLLKYYHIVHPKYVTSKGFLVLLKETTEEISKQPHLVYSKLKLVIDELDTRRKAVYLEPMPPPPAPENDDSSKNEENNSQNVPVEEVVEKTGDKAKDLQLKKLYKALRIAKRTIADLEETEVNWDDDEYSPYLKKAQYEKRACEIYQKICEITGESDHAHRLTKKPIVYKGTVYPDFNKRLQKMVNRTGSFPNYRDVLKLLDFCNKKYEYHMPLEHQTIVAQEAFTGLGKVLQDRRKADLYETATFYTGKNKDPARNDPALRSQLEKNKKNYSKIDDIINDFTLKTEREDDIADGPSTSQAVEDDSDENESSQMSVDQQEKMSSQDTIIEIDESPVKNSGNKNLVNSNNNDDDDLILIS